MTNPRETTSTNATIRDDEAAAAASSSGSDGQHQCDCCLIM